MLRPNQSHTNFFSVLYDRIPEDHLLKRIANAVDFSFINELVADSYCASFGRPAKESELMAKLCILERLYNLSDVKVILSEVSISAGGQPDGHHLRLREHCGRDDRICPVSVSCQHYQAV